MRNCADQWLWTVCKWGTLPGSPNCRHQTPFGRSFCRHGSHSLESESSFYTEQTALASYPIMRKVYWKINAGGALFPKEAHHPNPCCTGPAVYRLVQREQAGSCFVSERDSITTLYVAINKLFLQCNLWMTVTFNCQFTVHILKRAHNQISHHEAIIYVDMCSHTNIRGCNWPVCV